MLVRPVGQDHPQPWNKGALVGQKKPLQPKHVWSIRVRLEIARRWRDLALFNLAIDSKLRACDLVRLRIDEVCSRAKILHRATVVQKKTGRPVQFEVTEQTKASLPLYVVLNILARQRDPAPPANILTPAALTLRHAPIADCARYDNLRRTI